MKPPPNPPFNKALLLLVGKRGIGCGLGWDIFSFKIPNLNLHLSQHSCKRGQTKIKEEHNIYLRFFWLKNKTTKHIIIIICFSEMNMNKVFLQTLYFTPISTQKNTSTTREMFSPISAIPEKPQSSRPRPSVRIPGEAEILTDASMDWIIPF